MKLIGEMIEDNGEKEMRVVARTFVNLAEGSTTELLDDSVAFVQNFLAFLEHDVSILTIIILIEVL
jgi:hypothetical protein